MIRPLSIQDLLFSNTILECEANDGVRYVRMVRTGMPRIPSSVLKSIFYLYRNTEDAKNGHDPQGTGFLVGVHLHPQSTSPEVYAIATWHTAVDNSDPENPPAPVIRLNRKDDEPAVIPLGVEDWRFIPDLDVAVAPIQGVNQFDVLCVPTDMFLTKADIGRQGIDVGDDVFMMGLFVDHEGGPKNVPAARFGNISMMPNSEALVPQGALPHVPAFVLDLHSRTGYSGSPAFVYRTFGSDLTVPIDSYFRVEVDQGLSRGGPRMGRGPAVELHIDHKPIFKLLGLHFAQFPEELESHEGMPITGLSGMTCAIPAWRIIEVLNLPEFVEQRERSAKRMEQENKKKPRLEKVKKPKAGKPIGTGDRDRFNRLLDAAVKPPKSSDQT